MKASLRIPFALLALLAMFATLLPQTLWACPMNGRVDRASRVCLGMMPVVKGEMPCAGSGSKCCKPVTLPASKRSAPPLTRPAALPPRTPWAAVFSAALRRPSLLAAV